MPIATGLAIGLGAASAAAGLGGAAIAAHGAGKAADAQVQGAEYAANLQHQDAQAALAFQKQEYADQQKNFAPFLAGGTKAFNTLSSDLYNGTFAPFTGQFQAPTAATEQNDPGYQFRLQQGQKALEQSAAARGGLLTGGTAKAEQEFGQNYASNEYQNVYNRARDQFDLGYNIFEQNQANKFNRLAAVAGVGQTAAGQLSSAGGQAASGVNNILLTSGQQIGNDYQNAAAARASGYAASANAYGGALKGGVNSIADYLLLSQLHGGSALPYVPDQSTDFYTSGGL